MWIFPLSLTMDCSSHKTNCIGDHEMEDTGQHSRGTKGTHKVSFSPFPASFFTLHPIVLLRNTHKTGIKGISLPLDLDWSCCARLNHLSSKSAQALRMSRWNNCKTPWSQSLEKGETAWDKSFKRLPLRSVFFSTCLFLRN